MKVWLSSRLVVLLSLALAVVLMALSAAGQNGRTPPPPSTPGTYLLDGNNWVAMPHILPRGKRMRQIYRQLVPAGAAKFVLVFNGAEASTKITDKKPVFLITGGSPAQPSSDATPQFILVRLERHETSRDLQVTKGATMFDLKKEIPPDKIVPTATATLGTGSYTLAPEIELTPGEYLLTYARGEIGGYDFSVKSK